jgi:hypothetical protein
LGLRDAVWIAALYGVYFVAFSHLIASVSNLSVWHIINKSSKFRGSLSCAGPSWLKIEPICDPLQAGRVFLDVVHFGYLRGAVAQEVSYLAGRECHERSVWLTDAVDQ